MSIIGNIVASFALLGVAPQPALDDRKTPPKPIQTPIVAKGKNDPPIKNIPEIKETKACCMKEEPFQSSYTPSPYYQSGHFQDYLYIAKLYYSWKNSKQFAADVAAYSESIIRRIKNNAKSEILLNALNITLSLPESKHSQGTLLNYFLILSKHNSPITDNALKLFIGALQNERIKTPKQLQQTLLEITSQVIIADYLKAGTENEREIFRAEYETIAVADNLPYPEHDPRNQKAFNDVARIHYRAKSIRHGFSPLMIDFRRPPNGDFPLFVRFGTDVSKEVFYIDAKDKDSAPGRGFFISGLNLNKIFVPDFTAKARGEDPYKAYMETWTELANDIYSAEDTKFMFTRLGIIVSSPEDKSHELTISSDGKKVHYSYFISNDHFGGKDFKHNGSESFYLIPTEVIENKLKGSLIPYKDFNGYGTARKDINDCGFTLYDLEQEADKIGAPVYHLGSGSTFAGGFSNAIRPGKKWYYPNELELAKLPIVVSDAWGHTHKGDITGRYISGLTGNDSEQAVEMREKFKVHAKVHEEIVKVAKSLQNRLEILLLGYSDWQKGFTISEIPAEVNPEDVLAQFDGLPIADGSNEDSLYAAAYDGIIFKDSDRIDETFLPDNAEDVFGESFNMLDLKNAEQVLETSNDISAILKNPNAYRMLDEAYKWHNGGKLKGITDKSFYPILALGPRTNLWIIQKSPFYLDTHNMAIKVGDYSFQFPDSGSGKGNEKAEELWRDFVAPHLLGDNSIRFYDRRDLGIG